MSDLEPCKVIKHKQGTTFNKEITVTDGAVTSLAGYTIRAQLRKSSNDPTPIATFTITPLDQIAFPMKASMTLTAAQSSALPVNPISSKTKTPTPYIMDIEVVRPDGTVFGSTTIDFLITPEVTK